MEYRAGDTQNRKFRYLDCNDWHAKGIKVLYDDGSNIAKAQGLAHKADVASVVVVNHPTCNAGWAQCLVPSNGKEGVDRKTIVLKQEELVKRIFAVDPHIFLQLCT